MVAALPAALRELSERAAFRLYVTDALYCVGNNKRMSRRFADLLEGKQEHIATRDEADAMAKRLGIRFVEEQ